MSEKSDRRNAKLGFFVLIGIILFLIAVFFIGTERNLFTPTFELHTGFKDVSGLTRGNNVWLSGVKIGIVRDVEIVSDSIVRVSMRIREEDRRFINEDATAFISSDGLVGNMIVVIEPGPSGREVEDGAMIASGEFVSPQDIMETVQTTGQNILAITEDVQRLAQQVTNGEGTIGRLLSSPEMADNVEVAIQNLETTSQRTARMSSELSQMVQQIRQNEDGPVQTLMTDTAFAAVYDSLLLNLQTTGQNMSEISSELEQLSSRMTQEENALNVVLNDTTFSENLQRTMENASEATRKLDENMEALQHHWLFRGFFRRRDR